MVLDSTVGYPQNYSVNGTYVIAASGYGYLSHPLSSGDRIYGLVSNGVFLGSSTESSFNDLFVAAQLTSPQASVAALKGPYTLVYFDFSQGTPYYAYDALWQMSPDGAGNLGAVSLKTYLGANGASAVTQTINGVKYIFSNGAANMQFPSSQNAMISGNEYLYLSPDGNFVFGGSPNGFDFFMGVRTPASTGGAGLNGLYYQAGIDLDASTLSMGYGTLDTFYGALTASGGSIIAHRRLSSAFASIAIDHTFADKYTVNPNGMYTGATTQYVIANAGGFRLGLGIGPYLGIAAAVPVAPFTGTGVYLNPTGVVNAASSAPFTAGIAPGELITLYGANLAPETQVAPSVPFPTMLAGVQVLINGVAAPIYYVSPTQASVIVPYWTYSSIAQIQVANNGSNSNVVTAHTNLTAPGVFTNPVGGTGYVAAVHSDGSLVTTSNPAMMGEYISVYLTGLGAVSPSISDGDAGPVSPLSKAANTIAAYVGGQQATVTFTGLAPQYAGLYQVNLQVPTGLTAGDNLLGIDGPDFYTEEGLLSVTASTAGAQSDAVHRLFLPPHARGMRGASPRRPQ
jgi:uncharacterized protein (TIGR03437 family)